MTIAGLEPLWDPKRALVGCAGVGGVGVGGESWEGLTRVEIYRLLPFPPFLSLPQGASELG